MIVLDTHTLGWWAAGDNRLSHTARDLITSTIDHDIGQRVLFSAITTWEIAMLQQRERLVLSMDLDEWLHTVESMEGVEAVPLTPSVAIESTRLPGDFHKDPADRFIVALARQLNVPLVTADRKIRDYPHIRTVW